jgi:hypothetical protein
MSAKRIQEWLLALLAFPLCMLWQIAKYANTGKGCVEKLGIFIAFVPAVVILTLLWGTLWVLALNILSRAVRWR